DAETRPFAAAALFRAGLVRQVLVTSPLPFPEQEDGILPPEQEVARKVLLARGVPDEAIVVLPGEVASTADEARALAAFLDARGEGTVAVVTNDFHTRRARLAFRRVLGERCGLVQFVGAPMDDFDASNWWQSEGGLVLYLREFVKYGVYLCSR